MTASVASQSSIIAEKYYYIWRGLKSTHGKSDIVLIKSLILMVGSVQEVHGSGMISEEWYITILYKLQLA